MVRKWLDLKDVHAYRLKVSSATIESKFITYFHEPLLRRACAETASSLNLDIDLFEVFRDLDMFIKYDGQSFSQIFPRDFCFAIKDIP